MSQNQFFSKKNILKTWIFWGHPKIKVEPLKTTLTFGLMSFLKTYNKFHHLLIRPTYLYQYYGISPYDLHHLHAPPQSQFICANQLKLAF
jgi:hypothetical protein